MRPLSPIRALLCAVLLSACIGGTGTDTDNGVDEDKGPLGDHDGAAARVVDSDGNPIAGAVLTLHTPGFRPDSGAAESLVLDPSRPLVTDSQGYARFDLRAPGKVVVEGRLGEATLFFDTLAVADVRTLAAYTFRARPATPARGRVRLASGLKVVSGAVFLRGTSRWSPLDSAGGYDLGTLPVDFAALAVGLTYRSAVREVLVAEQRVPIAGPVLVDTARPGYNYACREVSGDSASRLLDAGTPKDAAAGAAVDTARLDTGRVAALARSCDSLSAGTVVAVRSPSRVAPADGGKDTVTTPYLAVGAVAAGGTEANSSKSGGSTGMILVPLAGCVPAPGASETTFDLTVQPAAGGRDVLVGDVADRCLSR